MSFDKFLLAVESRDLSQADKSIKRVSSFPKLSETSFSVAQRLRPEFFVNAINTNYSFKNVKLHKRKMFQLYLIGGEHSEQG